MRRQLEREFEILEYLFRIIIVSSKIIQKLIHECDDVMQERFVEEFAGKRADMKVVMVGYEWL